MSKKFILFIGLLFSVCVGSMGQAIEGTLTRSGSYKLLDENRTKFTYDQFGDYVETRCPEAYEAYEKYVNQSIVAGALLGCALGCEIGGAICSKNGTDLAPMAIALDVCAIGCAIPALVLSINAPKNKSKAVNIWNEHVLKSRKETSELQFGIGGHGLAFLYNF